MKMKTTKNIAEAKKMFKILGGYLIRRPLDGGGYEYSVINDNPIGNDSVAVWRDGRYQWVTVSDITESEIADTDNHPTNTIRA